MIHPHILSSRKKTLAIIVSILFIVFAIVVYKRYANNFLASILMAQEKEPFVQEEEPSTVVDENDKKNQQNDLKGKQNFLKDMQSEVKGIQKETKNTVNTATVDGLISKFSSCIATLQSMIGSPDYWNSERDCSDIRSDVETELQDNLRPARDCHQNKRNIEDRKKEKKNNIDSQIKNILRNNKNADVSPLTAIVIKMDEQFAKAAAVSACTPDGNDVLRDVSSELNSLFQDFYNTSSEVGNTAEEARKLKENQKDFDSNFKKNCAKQLKREFTDYEKEIGKGQKKRALTADQQLAYDTVKFLYTELCTTIIANMEQSLETSDNETFQDLRQGFWTKETDFRNEVNESRQGVQEQEQKEESLKNVTRDLQQKKRDLARMQKELKRTNKLFTRAAKKYLDKAERKEALAAFAGYVAQAKDLVTRIETGLAAAKEEAASDPDAYWNDRNEELNDLQNEFNELQSNIQNIANSLQTIKDVEGGLKSAQKDLANIRRESEGDPELMKNLEDILAQVQELLQQAWSLLVTDPEEAMEVIQDINQLQNDWHITLQDWRESQYDNGNAE